MFTIFNVRPKALNVGNDIIGQATRLFIQRAFRQVPNIITIPATNRYESHATGGLTARMIYEINQYGHGVIVGGGNLYENGELDVNLDALEALAPPVMLFSLSMGRVYARGNRLVRRTDAMPDRTCRALNAKAAVSLARDEATLAHLHGIGAKNAQLGGCPTLYLDALGDRLPALDADDRDLTLISVRNPALMNVPLQVQSRVRGDLLAMTDFLRARGHERIRLLCHDYRDIPFAASFPGLAYQYVEDSLTLLALFRHCRLNVTYRLHSALPCLAFGRPFIPISYDERALSAIATVGLGAWNIDMVLTKDVPGAVAERYGRLGDLDKLRREAQGRWSELRSTLEAGFDTFARAVGAYAEQWA